MPTAVPVVPVLPGTGTAATVPAPAFTTAAVLGGAEHQHDRRRGHPPDGVEEAEAEQDRDEDKEQDEHDGPPGAEQSITAGGRGLFGQPSPAT